jgi:Rad3-related DNA helicase
MRQIKGHEQQPNELAHRINEKIKDTKFYFLCLSQIFLTMKALRSEQSPKDPKQIQQISPETPDHQISDLEKFIREAGGKTNFLKKPIHNPDSVAESLENLKNLKEYYNSRKQKERLFIAIIIISSLSSALVAWNARGATLESPKKVSTENSQNISQLKPDELKNQ